MASQQETFDTVAIHLLKQGKRSTMPDMLRADGKQMCAYRNFEGLRCAVGCLIPDDVYEINWEGRNIYYHPISNYLKGEGYDITLLYDLQDIHDDKEPEAWKDYLIALANTHGLDPQVVYAFQRGAESNQEGSISGNLAGAI